MKLNSRDFAIPFSTEDTTTLAGELIERNQTKLKKYVVKARNQLALVKYELYDLLDAGYQNSQGFDILQTHDPLYQESPSVYMEKAFTLQTYDAVGKPIENRMQAYINSGVKFNRAYEILENKTPDQIFLHASADLINALNCVLSQLNKIEAYTTSGKFEEVATLLPALTAYVSMMYFTAQSPHLVEVVEQGAIQSGLSYLYELLLDLIDIFRNLGKNDTQIHQERFFKLKNSVVPPHTAPTETDEEDTDSAYDMV